MAELRKMCLPLALASLVLVANPAAATRVGFSSAAGSRELLQQQPDPVPIADFTSGALRESYR